jgi:ABC-type uncharacterized transport system permease subunit
MQNGKDMVVNSCLYTLAHACQYCSKLLNILWLFGVISSFLLVSLWCNYLSMEQDPSHCIHIHMALVAYLIIFINLKWTFL